MIDPILIAGCPRSASFLVAGITYICGGFGGQMGGSCRHTRNGAFENLSIRDRVMSFFFEQAGWTPVSKSPCPESVLSGEFPNLRVDVESRMKYEGYLDGPWFYKDGRLLFVSRQWHIAFPRAKWIVVRRDRDELIHACMSTKYMQGRSTPAEWGEWVDMYEDRMERLREAIHSSRYLEVWPKKILEGDYSEVQAAIEAVGLRWRNSRVLSFVGTDRTELKGGK